MGMHRSNEHVADMHGTPSFQHVERKGSRQLKRQQKLWFMVYCIIKAALVSRSMEIMVAQYSANMDDLCWT